MNAVTVVANHLEYAFVADEPERLGERWTALASAQIVDEISGDPVRGTLAITADRPAILAKPGADGTFCLLVRPWLRFPPLLAPSTPIEVLVESDGYLALRHTFTLAYDERKIVVPAPVAGDAIARLTSVAGIVAGDTLLFGPAGSTQEYAGVASINAVTNEVTVVGRLSYPHSPGDSVFPDNFTTAPATILHARRVPVVIAGRVVRRNTALDTTAPVAGASVVLTDFWRTRSAVRTHQPGAMTNINPALRSFALALPSGIAAKRTTAVAHAGSMALPATPLQVKALLQDVSAGEATVTLSDRVGVGIGGIVEMDADRERAEYHEIKSVLMLGAVTEPARVGLTLALRRAHRTGARVERINAAAPPPATHVFRDDALPGDGTVFLDGIAGLPLQGTLRVTDGVVPDEYHAYSRYAATSDAGGYFRLPALHRIAAAHLTVTAGPDVQQIDFQPDYDERELRLDIVFAV